jgi:hypothetical protein
MQEQQFITTKSNLAKAEGGFGACFQARDGQNVVGAGHSLEEMIAMAERGKNKYTDDGPIHVKPQKGQQQFNSDAAVLCTNHRDSSTTNDGFVGLWFI